MRPFLVILPVMLILSCHSSESQTHPVSGEVPDSMGFVRDIPLSPGYIRVRQEPGSFGAWLRELPLKKDRHVYLYNGALKSNQTAQYAVINLPVGKKDLQQCADAVMRLRAQFLYDQGRYKEIIFRDNDGKSYGWNGGRDSAGFQAYLELVFARCGTASLERQLRQVESLDRARIGDVLIKGGFPGHAMIIVDEAINTRGEKIFLLAQSYMPAQDIHVVRNPGSRGLNPWYSLHPGQPIVTPEWVFGSNPLHAW